MGQIINNSPHRIVIFDRENKTKRFVCEPLDYNQDGEAIKGSNITQVPAEYVEQYSKSVSGLEAIANGLVVVRVGDPPKPKKGSFEALGREDQLAHIELEENIDKLTDLLAKEQPEDIKRALITRITLLAKAPKGKAN